MDFEPCPHCGAPLEHWELCRACVPVPSAAWSWAVSLALLAAFVLATAAMTPPEPPALEGRR